MSNTVLVIAEHLGDSVSDVTYELIGKAKHLGGEVVVALLGAPQLASALGAADRVVTVDHPSLTTYTAEGWETALIEVVRQVEPRLVLVSTATAGLDLGGSLSVGWDAPLASYVIDLRTDGPSLVATAQIYGGKLLAEVELSGDRAICSVIAGSFPADAGRSGTPSRVDALAPPTALDSLRTSFLSLHQPEAGDVDITTADLLIAVGRGIGSQDNLELVQELADVLGAPLAASRPITDQGWLPKSRQVGKSGLKVKPRAYLMFGISGAPEHLEGMRNAELIIACNTDAQAPIFDVAHYGATVDLFDLVPALVDKVS